MVFSSSYAYPDATTRGELPRGRRDARSPRKEGPRALSLRGECKRRREEHRGNQERKRKRGGADASPRPLLRARSRDRRRTQGVREPGGLDEGAYLSRW